MRSAKGKSSDGNQLRSTNNGNDEQGAGDMSRCFLIVVGDSHTN